MTGKILIFSAPSGAGKTTIIRNLLDVGDLSLEFSVSACTRPKRKNEIQGKDYYFYSVEKFKEKIKNNEFLEWEEVYKDHYYGSLKSEVERITKNNKNVVFDVDVKGGINIKNYYGESALSVFIMPPSIEVLEKRLVNRSTDSERNIKKRIERAKFEISFAEKFDKIIINENLENSINETENLIRKFLEKNL